jgi:hypothetical protein
VAQAFPNDEAVNEALRLVLQLSKIPASQQGSSTGASDAGA